MDWNQVLSFVLAYWREILSISGVIISILIYCCKKRPSYNAIDKIKEDILELLPTLILKVEEDGNGQRKKNAVLEFVKIFVKKKYKMALTSDLESFVINGLESILSTPQKKER